MRFINNIALDFFPSLNGNQLISFRSISLHIFSFLPIYFNFPLWFCPINYLCKTFCRTKIVVFFICMYIWNVTSVSTLKWLLAFAFCVLPQIATYHDTKETRCELRDGGHSPDASRGDQKIEYENRHTDTIKLKFKPIQNWVGLCSTNVRLLFGQCAYYILWM